MSGIFTHYRAQVVPWLWFLTRQADCRIFQNLAVPDIISQVFNLFDFKDFRLSLKSSYPQLEYCVQYRETSFNFVSRLMEEFGIFYYFDHSVAGQAHHGAGRSVQHAARLSQFSR